MDGVLLFIPHPINIYVSRNTFVRFCTNGSEECIGLIEEICPGSYSVIIRQFMTWMQVRPQVIEYLTTDLTFWPTDSVHNPIYLCDSDVVVTHSIHTIVGIAFVFYYDDQVVPKLSGLANTYIVSSFFNSVEKSIIHGPSFSPFPRTFFNGSLVSCFPSILFRQLLGIKQKVHVLMNTRSLGSRCIQSCVINNIDPLTWHYIQGILMVPASLRNTVQKQHYVCNDEFVLEKYRSEENIIELTLPEHLSLAQKLFGTAAGIGTRQVMRCSLKRHGLAAREVSYQQMRFDNDFNIISFEVATDLIEVCRRGIELKYVTQRMDLFVTVRYRKMIGRTNVEPHLQARNMINASHGIVNDAYPLHVDTAVFGSVIKKVSLMTQCITLTNNTIFHLNDVIREIDRLI